MIKMLKRLIWGFDNIFFHTGKQTISQCQKLGSKSLMRYVKLYGIPLFSTFSLFQVFLCISHEISGEIIKRFGQGQLHAEEYLQLDVQMFRLTT